MLTKSLPELQRILKSGDAESAARAGQIIRAITKRKPDDFLKNEKLEDHINVYKKYLKKSLEDLKKSLENIKSLPAIDVIIILHLVGNFKTPSKIKWPSQDHTVTTAELALILDISDRRIQQLAAKNILPRADRGKYSLRDTVPAYIRYITDYHEQKKSTGSLREEQAKFIKLKAHREELEIKKIEGSLLPADQLHDVLSRWAVMLRNRILSIPHQLKLRHPDISDEGIKILSDIAHKILIETSQDKMETIMSTKKDDDL